MRTCVMVIATAVAAMLGGCGAEAPAPAAEIAEPAAPEPKRLPIGEITPADVPALMATVYPEGVPDTAKDLGVFVMGERVGLLVGTDSAEACAECTGSLSLFYIARMDTGFVVQADYRDFHKSGSGGKFNREIKAEQFGGLDGGPSYAGFTDVNVEAGCDAKMLTVGIFTEAGPRTALKTSFGHGRSASSVEARIVEAEPYQADFAIAYESWTDDFVAPYLFVNQALRPSFPVPDWTKAKC